jgi:glycosyltransferase involved in cell wall biosynthesis
MAKTHILYISFYFPPLAAVASLRAVKMVKYLFRQDCELSVVSASPLLAKSKRDDSTLADIPSNVRVHRALFPDPAWCYKLLHGFKHSKLVLRLDKRLFFTGSHILWLPFAKRKIDMVMKGALPPQIAVVSVGPPAALELALYLKEKYDVSYILDWRDEWLNNPEWINNPQIPKATNREHLLESKALKAASGNVYLTQLMRDNFIRRYPILHDKPSRIIPNGFDEEDFTHLPQPQKSDSAGLQIYYSGSFYDRRQPDALWQAVSELLAEKKIEEQSLHFCIRGHNKPAFVMGKYAHLAHVVSIKPYQAYRENLQDSSQADVLLLYIPGGENTDSVLTAKVFEYLRLSKPVLAIVPPQGAAAQLLREAGIGYIASDAEVEKIKEQILILLKTHRESRLGEIQTNPAVLARYSRENQAKQLRELIAEII